MFIVELMYCKKSITYLQMVCQDVLSESSQMLWRVTNNLESTFAKRKYVPRVQNFVKVIFEKIKHTRLKLTPETFVSRHRLI